MRVYTQEQKDRKNELKRFRYAQNPEKFREIARQKRAKDPQKFRDIVNKSNAKYRKERNEYGTRYYHENKEKCLAGNKKWREENREYWLKKMKETNYPRKKRFQEQANAYKLQHGCIDCGYKAHAIALQFDHVYGVKVKDVSQFNDWDLALEEVAKCVVRCSNCHAIKTFQQKEYRGWRKRLDNPNG